MYNVSRESEFLKIAYQASLSLFIRKSFETVSPGAIYMPNWHIDAFADHLTACKDGNIKRLIINVPPRSLKPLSINCLVTTKFGRKKLGDIVVGDVVLTHSGKFQKVLNLSERKMLPCLKIKSESGREIVSALDHPFLLPCGWKKAKDLKIGEILALKFPIEDFGVDLKISEPRLLGYIIGDGNIEYEYISDEIVEISNAGTQECMCIEVDNDHTFCANDFVVKNSISCTVAFPAWLLGIDPEMQIMAASYSQALSHKHSQDSRFIMQSDWYKAVFPKTILAPDQNEKRKFMTTSRGQRMAVSVGSTATGEGGDILIADDILNPEQAASDVERSGANHWFKNTFSTRLNSLKDGCIIVVMQRLHELDLTGMLLDQGGWEHLCLPALNDKRKTISIGCGKTKEWEVGEYLHEARIDEKVLEKVRTEMGAMVLAGQYLQKPAPEGGGIIKEVWWKHWKGKESPKVEYMIQVYDTAFSAKTSNDYSARTTWGIFLNEEGIPNIIMLERLNKRLEFPDLVKEAKFSYNDLDPDVVLIEEKASGVPLLQELRNVGIRVRGIPRNANSGDKISRANNITIVFEQGVVWVPCNSNIVDGKEVWAPKPWAQEVIDQCSIFPNGAHDDLVDTVIDSVAFLRRYKGVELKTDKDDDPQYIRETGKKKRFY